MRRPARRCVRSGGSVRRRLACARSEQGFTLVELMIAMILLSVVVAPLVAAFSSSVIGLGWASVKGTAAALVDQQMEVYRPLPYDQIRLSNTDVGNVLAGDPYLTAHTSDATIPSGAGAAQILDTKAGHRACPSDGSEPACLPIQVVTGPDNHRYRIDTYIVGNNAVPVPGSLCGTPPCTAREVKVVTVIVRSFKNSVPGQILARATSSFDQLGAPSATTPS